MIINPVSCFLFSILKILHCMHIIDCKNYEGLNVKSRYKNRVIKSVRLSNLLHHRVILIQKKITCLYLELSTLITTMSL